MTQQSVTILSTVQNMKKEAEQATYRTFQSRVTLNLPRNRFKKLQTIIQEMCPLQTRYPA